MSRFGSRVSSPRVAAASKPAKDRKPKTTPRNTADSSVPGATVNTLRSKVCPSGAEPDTSRTRMIAEMTRISATVTPSTVSSTLVPRRTGATVSSSARSSATAIRTNPAQSGGFGQTPISSRNAVPKMPNAEAVTTP